MAGISRPKGFLFTLAFMPPAILAPECLLSCGTLVIPGASSGIGEKFVKAITAVNSRTRIFSLSRTPPSESPASGKLQHCPPDLSSAAGQEAATAAFQPTPLFAIYEGPKAFLVNWSLGLWRELRDTEVHGLGVPRTNRNQFFSCGGF